MAIDIGGTHARFALAAISAGGAITLGEPTVLQTRDHPSFADAWAAFAHQQGAHLPRAAAIAVAGPVTGDEIRFTNNPWALHPARLAADLGVDRLAILNDFAAVAHAVAHAPPDQFLPLCGPDTDLPARGTISVIGPGTGLGVAHLCRDGAGGAWVQPTEGGHFAFAPLDPIDDAILAHLRQHHARVSVERVVSGPGIVAIHAALAAQDGRAIAPLDDRTIWDRGIAGQDELATAAVERFCLSLGAVAGDIALVQGAGGVVIAGGLGLRLRETLRRSGFARRFVAKGRFEPMMAAIPVKLITHPQPGLLGAVAAFAQQHV